MMLNGSLTALVTPMTADGLLDLKAYKDFIDWQINEGTDGVIPMGTTGETRPLAMMNTKRRSRRVLRLLVGGACCAGTGSTTPLRRFP